MSFVKNIIGEVTGSRDASRAADRAASTQAQSAADATAEARREYDVTRQDQLNLLTQQRSDQQPWVDAGRNALTQIMQGIGPDGQFTIQPYTGADILNDPGYQFRQQQGQQAIERSAAARGGLLSGAAAKALTRYSQGVASEEFNNGYNRTRNDQATGYNRLASLAGVGQQATNQIGQAGQNAYGTIASAGQNTSSAVQNNLLGAGNARASAYITQGNQWGRDVNMLTKLAGQYMTGGMGK